MSTMKAAHEQLDGRLLVGGTRRVTAEQYALTDPYRGARVADVHLAGAGDVEGTIAAAISGQREVALLPVHRRAAILRRAADLALDRKELYASTIARQTGKALRDASREIERGASTLRASATAAETLFSETAPADALPSGEGLIAIEMREPAGIVVAVAPFNAPFNLVLHKVAPAIAGGNAVIVKPSRPAPLTSFQIAELLVDAGLPPAAISVVPASAEITRSLVSHDAVRVVSFTGGPEAGRAIALAAPLKRLSLELGGNSANIVHHDADLDWAARALAAGGVSNTGQSCNSVQRIIVHRDVEDRFRELLVQNVSALTTGDPLDPETDVGTLVNEAAARRVEESLERAVADGAMILTGGKRQGAALAPAVLARVTQRMDIACNEIFGPVVLLISYERIEDAIAIANDTPYGLQAGVFTSSLDVTFTVARGVRAGGVMVNRSSNFRLDHLPFGGVKASGTTREGARYALEEMTERKLVLIDPSLSGSPHPLARRR